MRPLLLLALAALLAGCAEPMPGADGDAPATPEQPTPATAGGESCFESSMEASPDALHAGGSVRIRETLTNCGPETVRVGETPCDAPYLWTLAIRAYGKEWELPAVPWEHPAMEPRTGCEGERPVIELAPGDSSTLERRWNGMFLECLPERECVQKPAAPGTYALQSRLTAGPAPPGTWRQRDDTQHVVVMPPESNQNRTLVLRTQEWAWVNRTDGQGSILADYGPHCAPARLTRDPPTLTLQQEPNATTPEALLFRDLRAGGRPENVSSFGEGTRVDALGNGTLAATSAYDGSRALFHVGHRDGEAVVDGVPLALNETREFRVDYETAQRGATFRVSEIVRLTNLGPVPVLSQEPLPCL